MTRSCHGPASRCACLATALAILAPATYAGARETGGSATRGSETRGSKTEPRDAAPVEPLVCPELRCVDGRAEVAPAGPYAISLDAAAGIGFFFATHGKLAVNFGRTFWNRLETELSVRFVVGSYLTGIEGSARIGVLLHLSQRWRTVLGWRVGYSHFAVELPITTLSVGSPVGSAYVELRYLITPHVELRLAPLVGTGYWNEVWGFIIEPGAGLAFRL